MRSRSCALHSDSPEEFLQMAQMAMNSPGLFYDDKVNRKIISSIASQSSESTKKSTSSFVSSQLDSRKENLWASFDFDMEIQVDRQERQELERMKECPMKQVNLGIITSYPSQVLVQLSCFLGVTPAKEQIQRGLNLVTSCRDNTIYKYWIVSKQFLRSESLLTKVYLDHCCCVYDMDGAQDSGGIFENWRNWNIPALLI